MFFRFLIASNLEAVSAKGCSFPLNNVNAHNNLSAEQLVDQTPCNQSRPLITSWQPSSDLIDLPLLRHPPHRRRTMRWEEGAAKEGAIEGAQGPPTGRMR